MMCRTISMSPRRPDANVDLPIEERRPGGLGLHLIRRLVDSWALRVFERKPAEPKSRSERHSPDWPGEARASDRKGAGGCMKIRIWWRRRRGVIAGAGWYAAQCAARRRRFSSTSMARVTLDLPRARVTSRAPAWGCLLKTQKKKRLTASAGKLRLVGVSHHLLDIFRYSGFDQIFENRAPPAERRANFCDRRVYLWTMTPIKPCWNASVTAIGTPSIRWLVRYQRPPLQRVRFWVLRSAEDANDVTQIVFLKIAEQLDGIRSPLTSSSAGSTGSRSRVAQPAAPEPAGKSRSMTRSSCRAPSATTRNSNTAKPRSPDGSGAR